MGDVQMMLQIDHPVQAFKQLFRTLSATNCERALLAQVYAPHLVFEDSFHRIEGLDNLQEYFQNVYSNVTFCEFEFIDEWVAEDSAMLTWKMRYAHKLLKLGKTIEVDGASHLKFDTKVVYHRDYLDGGAMLYEQIPLLGTAIRQIKKRMVTS